MTATDKVVIIGGGLIGVATLHELARRGLPATLLEAESALGSGASYANGGLLTASMSDPWNAPGAVRVLLSSFFDPYAALKCRLHALPGLATWGLRFLRNSSETRHVEATRSAFLLARRSVEGTRDLMAQLAIPCDAASSGTLKVFATRGAAERPTALAAQLAPLGLRYELLDVEGLLQLEPELTAASSNFACGLYYPDDATGDALAFTHALAQRAVGLGAEIMTSVLARGVRVSSGRVVGVETSAGFIEAGRIVLAAGHASPSLSRHLVSLPIKPAKGYSLTFDSSTWPAKPALAVVDDAMHAAIVPLGSRIRVVGTAEFAGVNVAIDPVRIENLRRLFARLYPQLAVQAAAAEAQEWAGLRPMSADGLPFIGPAGPEGLWVNTGHGHLGWTMAVGSAELIADLMMGSVPAVRPEPYAPGR